MIKIALYHTYHPLFNILHELYPLKYHSVHEAVFYSRLHIQTYSFSLYVKMGLFVFNNSINIYNLPTSGNVVFKQWSPLQPPHNKEHFISYSQHPRHVLHPVLHTQWIASGRQLGAGRRLITITIILPFLMCHRRAS